MLYFAYGSNMDEARMTEPNRCPNARFIFNALLTGYRLAFTRQTQAGTGAADILAADGGLVWGVVYDITESDKRQLDKREGVPIGAYRQIDVFVHPKGDSSQRVKALTYVVCNPASTHQRPTPQYLNYLLQGARRWNLPVDYTAQIESITTTA